MFLPHWVSLYFPFLYTHWLKLVKFQSEENAIIIWNYSSFSFVCGFCLYCPWRPKDTVNEQQHLKRCSHILAWCSDNMFWGLKSGWYLFHPTENLVTIYTVYVTDDIWNYDHFQMCRYINRQMATSIQNQLRLFRSIKTVSSDQR